MKCTVQAWNMLLANCLVAEKTAHSPTSTTRRIHGGSGRQITAKCSKANDISRLWVLFPSFVWTALWRCCFKFLWPKICWSGDKLIGCLLSPQSDLCHHIEDYVTVVLGAVMLKENKHPHKQTNIEFPEDRCNPWRGTVCVEATSSCNCWAELRCEA